MVTLIKNKQLTLEAPPPEVRFVELLARSNFSFLLGASHPDEMVREAQAYGYQGLGLCDVNGLYGVARGYREANLPSTFEKKEFEVPKDFRFHVGAEMTLPDGSVTLLAMNKKGYGNLCRIITESKRPAPKGYSALQDDQIFFHNEGLIACVLPPWNRERLEKYRQVFGDRLYLPVHRDLTWESRVTCTQAFQLEKEGFQIFVSQRPYFHCASRKKLHDVLTCLYHKKTLQEAGQIFLPNAERRLHSLQELSDLWRDRPDLLQKTIQISDRLEFKLSEIRYQYPQSFLPPGMSSLQFLRHLCEKEVPIRFPDGIKPKHQALIEKELEIIAELKYEDYFLTLWEIIQFAKEKQILFQGRGSAANSIVCFLLGLTSVHPEQIEMLFERFISVERKEPPDIDIDFEHERREEVIQHIYQKYGSERAAMVCNVICYRARMALRDICKVLGISEDTVGQMVKYMGREGFSKLKEDPNIFARWELDARLFNEAIELVPQLRGFPRHLGIHSGGFVITENCLLDNVPVEKATMEGRYVVQWNKDDIDTLGLMKVDLLSLGMLTALRKCLDLLRRHKKIDWKLYEIPQDDAETYAMIQKADTVGVFQIESRAQMSLLPRLKPKDFYDLVIEVAIVRPGPIQGGMIHPFLKRRDGLEKPDYPHPALIPILKRTLGVPLFQEQVMQIMISVAGFTPGEADQMRRIMSNAWRKQSQMEGLRQRIYEGLRKNGIPDAYIERIYKTVEGFASYGFPESHSASFALLTYASCYIKWHHPDVFACALLNSQPMGFYAPRTLIWDAQRHGVKFLPLSVQFSDEDYKMEGESSPHIPVRVGFRSISGFPKSAIDTIVQERKANGLYKDLSDFIRRTGLRLPVLLKLAQAGALLDLGLSAREALWKLPSFVLDQGSFLHGQAPTLSAKAEGSVDETNWSPPKPTEWEELSREYASKGFSLDRHPLSLLRPSLHRLNQELKKQRKGLLFSSSKDLLKIPSREWVRFVGLLSVQQKPPTAKGVSFLTLEDEHGFFNVVLMPKVYEECRLITSGQALLEITGRLEKVNGVINIIASKVIPAQKYDAPFRQTEEKAPQLSPDLIRPRMFH
jgi:DNA polymerase-3 subunit alpha/error-prone DNA polymerase